MTAPKPGSPEWQEQLNRQVDDHDQRVRESGDKGQTFEISQGGRKQ